MRAGKIFINDLLELGLLEKVRSGFDATTRRLNVLPDQNCENFAVCPPPRVLLDVLKIIRYGSLAATGANQLVLCLSHVLPRR
jgi:hypothetical protein